MNGNFTTTPRRLHSITEVAGMLGVSRAGVYRLVSDGRLHPVRIGRRSLITADELDGLVEQLVAEASSPAAKTGHA
jgi:excisionase family DNA binding protein